MINKKYIAELAILSAMMSGGMTGKHSWGEDDTEVSHQCS